MSVVDEAMDRFGLRKRKKVFGMPVGRKQTDWRKVAGIGAGAGAAGAAGVAGKKAMGRSGAQDDDSDEDPGANDEVSGSASDEQASDEGGTVSRMFKRPAELLHKGEDALEAVKDVGGKASDVSKAVGGETSTFGKMKAAVQAIGGDGDGDGGDEKKQRLIIQEQIDVAVPAQVAYDAWRDFEEFDEIFRAVQQVEVDESGEDEDEESETKTKWQAKILLSTREWTSEITDEREDERIAWTTSGDVDHLGAVSFHPLSDRLTRIHLEMEYHPTGIVEKFGNLFLTVRHRVRKDLRLFKHHLELEGVEDQDASDEDDDAEDSRASASGDEESSDAEAREGREGQSSDQDDQSQASDDEDETQASDDDDEDETKASDDENGSQASGGDAKGASNGGKRRSTSPGGGERRKSTQRSISP